MIRMLKGSLLIRYGYVIVQPHYDKYKHEQLGIINPLDAKLGLSFEIS